MTRPACPQDEFIALFETHGPRETAKRLGIGERQVYDRRVKLEKHIGRQITAPDRPGVNLRTRFAIEHPQRHVLEVADGIVLVGSDGHYWPGIVSPAHRAFVHFAKKLKPKAIIVNGDALDASTISRFSPIGWEKRPDLVDEVEASQERHAEIERAAPNAEKVWTLGNHDGRFETRLATVAPEFAKLHGVHLKDHFPYWHPCWACWINPEGETVVVKHRYKAGIHAPWNNTMWAGTHIITGHLHSLKVYPFSDYRGTRYGVDCGTLAGAYGPQFVDYTEDSPVNWRSGFIVLTFRSGRLMWPEPVYVIDENHVGFQGQEIEV